MRPILLLALIACTSASAHSPEDFQASRVRFSDARALPPLQIDSLAYTARPIERVWSSYRYAFTAVVRATNRGTAPVYFQGAPGEPYPMYGVEYLGTPGHETRSRADALREAAYSPEWDFGGSGRTIELRPGAARVDTIVLSGPNGWNGRTHRPYGVLSGDFRVIYWARACPGAGPCARPDAVWMSNPFQVRLAGAR